MSDREEENEELHRRQKVLWTNTLYGTKSSPTVYFTLVPLETFRSPCLLLSFFVTVLSQMLLEVYLTPDDDKQQQLDFGSTKSLLKRNFNYKRLRKVLGRACKENFAS